MALRTTYSAENWERVYQAFSDVSFVSYDFDTIKRSLVDYTRTYYPEVFNDFVESSEFVALIELFAYVAEQLAYRVDMLAHENFLPTARRKQSVLRLARLISYRATRNIAVRGLVKFQTVSTTEHVVDSRGTDLSGLTITWNDPNNPNWKEQFVLVMNRVLNSRFGQPHKTFQIGDVVMDLYSLRNDPSALRNGVFSFAAEAGLDSYQMELVPADLDVNGPFEREPDLTSPMSVVYANDGIGDGSDYTGFLGFVKQGVLTRIDVDVDQPLPDRRLELAPTNVNHTDVWVQRVAGDGAVDQRWTQVDTLAEENLVFNADRSTRLKYEVDTRENDQVTVIFGDGDFSDIPQGLFRFWLRQSANRSVVIPKGRVQGVPFSFGYASQDGNTETCALTFGLTSTLQNGAASETIEHIRRAAPSAYVAQNRMVNGEDYNTFPLKDPTILRLYTVNRTFAGQPKHIDWNDASGQYENVKLVGDDLVMRYELGISSQTTSVSGQSLIDSVIEPLLSSTGVVNTLVHISATDPATRGVVSPPRRRFIEDNRGDRYRTAAGALIGGDGSLKEKTAIQGLIDRHWYGEPLEYVQDESGVVLARIPDPDLHPEDDSRIYAATVSRTIDGTTKFPPGDVGSGLQPIAEQDYFALRYNRSMAPVGEGDIDVHAAAVPGWDRAEVWTVEVQADGQSLAVRSNLRGSFPAGQVGDPYWVQPEGSADPVLFFTVSQAASGTALAPGDAFVLDTAADGGLALRSAMNLNGWWELMGYADLEDYAQGISEADRHALKFTTDGSTAATRQHSWVVLVRKIRQQPTQNVIGYEVHHRDLRLTVESPTTKFWYNSVDQLIDGETKRRVYDNVRVLRSNIGADGRPLPRNQVYDVVGPVKDADGVTDFHRLEVAPSDMLQEDDSGDLVPDRLLQFETFSAGNHEYFWLDEPSVAVAATATADPDAVVVAGVTHAFAPGAFVDSALALGRRQRMPGVGSGSDGLDFMWQHFTPFHNVTDPSVTNIHDAYVMTRGYYDSVISYVRGLTPYAPVPPTPLELRNQYGEILKKKMMSDTVVMHPGRIRLLFGRMAEPQLRARFKIVRKPGGSLTNERIKEEALAVINSFFDIDNWDFGDTFYATQLISLIHRRLPADIDSVVLVPVYSTNSFGSLFRVEPGFDEILQSAAELSDIEIVDALTPTVMRQSK